MSYKVRLDNGITIANLVRIRGFFLNNELDKFDVNSTSLTV